MSCDNLSRDLRNRAKHALLGRQFSLADLLDDAADEIDRLRRSRDRLRAEVDSYIVEIERHALEQGAGQ